MARHTTFRIGGPAECMAFPRTEQELQQLLRFARERACPVLLLGGITEPFLFTDVFPIGCICFMLLLGYALHTEKQVMAR